MEKNRKNRFEEPSKKTLRIAYGKRQNNFMTIILTLFFATSTILAII